MKINITKLNENERYEFARMLIKIGGEVKIRSEKNEGKRAGTYIYCKSTEITEVQPQ